MYVTLREIEQAKANIAGILEPTQLQYSQTFSRLTGNEVYLKPENLQKTGAFKIRGAYNKIAQLSAEEKKRGVVAFSAGNHGAGVAYAAKMLGVRAVVVMPDEPVMSKKNAIEGYGAKVVSGGTNSIALYEKAMELHEREGLVLVHPFEDKHIIAGQGTIGMEILAELPETDTVIIPVSGGGLISGIATALKEIKPAVKVIGINSEGAMAMYESLQQGEPTEVKEINTIADGLMAKKPGILTFNHVKRYVDELALVAEEEIARTVSLCAERAKLVIEPSGAAALAALLSGRVAIKGEKVVTLMSGGNIDMKLFSELVLKYKS